MLVLCVARARRPAVRAAISVERPLGTVSPIDTLPLGVPRGDRCPRLVLLGPEHVIGTPASLHVESAVAKVFAIKAVPDGVPYVSAWLGCAFKRNAIGSEATPGWSVLPAVSLELRLVGGVFEVEGVAVQLCRVLG